MKKIFFILFWFVFCNFNEIQNEPIHSLSFSVKWKIYLWENYYKNKWINVLHSLTEKIEKQTTDTIKIGQLIHTGISGTSPNDFIKDQIKKYCIGGLILFKSNIQNKEQLKYLIHNLQQEALKNCQIPLFFSIDQEGGRVQRITDFVTEFPGAMAIGQTENPIYAWLNGFITGYELWELGIPFIFAPVADINNNPYNPVINTRSFGMDTNIVSIMVQNYIKGMNYTNSIGFLKHFPGHGDTNIDSHYDLPVIYKNIEELKKLELLPFQKGIEAGAKGVMIGHIQFPEIDILPSTISEKVINILKKDLNFNGIVISDAMEMKALSDRFPIDIASIKSILAGLDIILLTAQNNNVDKIYARFKEELLKNPSFKEKVRESFKKQILMKLESGIWDRENLNNFKIYKKELDEYFQLLEYKKNISSQIYTELVHKYPDISYRISYDAIRSYKKYYPEFDYHNENIIIFAKSRIIKEEINTIIRNEQLNNIHLYDMKHFIKN